jgi:predicted RNase H-like nuclease (RuvC/YqgF family)
VGKVSRAKKKRPSRAVVKKDFNDAIDRIVSGRPTSEALKELHKEGRLRLTFATVALEAGRSRSLIAHENCAYQDVRGKIIEICSKSASQKGKSKIVAGLREEISVLKSQLAAAMDAQVAHFAARQRAERESEKWRRAYRELTERTKDITTLRRV